MLNSFHSIDGSVLFMLPEHGPFMFDRHHAENMTNYFADGAQIRDRELEIITLLGQ